MPMRFYVEWHQYALPVTGYKSWYECVYDSVDAAAALESMPRPDREETMLSLKSLLVENSYSLGKFLLRALNSFTGIQFSLFSKLLISDSPGELMELQRLVSKVEAGAVVIAFVENEGSLMSFVVKKESDEAVFIVALDRSRPYSVGHRAFVVLLANALLNPDKPIELTDDIDLDAITAAIREKRVQCS